jgi:hypothetical protein
MILAQADMGQLPASFLKEMVIFTLAAIVVMAFVVSALFAALQYFLEKRRENKPASTIVENDPLRMQKIYPSATVKELNDAKTEHGRRLDGHDREINDLWTTMRKEDKEIRHELSQQYQSISLALGRIEGRLSKE